MAQLVFAEAGRRLGATLLPNGLSAFGLSVGGDALGAALGSSLGRAVDNALAGPIGEVGRLDGLSVMESREGAGIPRVYGRYRIGGQVIWATHLKEASRDRSVGGKGGPSVTEYSYTISFAVGLCEGEISGLERIWANGEPLSLADVNYRLYRGSEDQLADPLIEASEGVAPAYRGLAYIVFEDLPLDAYGARLPQLSFEVTPPVAGSKRSLGDVVTGVNLIPASGEWVYSPELIRRVEYPGWEETLNRNSASGEVDVSRALDQLQAELPMVSSVNLTIAWFGNDLRCGVCSVMPGVETREQLNLPRDWRAGGLSRQTAQLISQDEDGRPYYGGTPDDASLLALCRDMEARGLSVTISPFLLMDVPPGNNLPDPYGRAEQPAFPWRGRLTSASDKSSAARVDVDAFFGSARASDFALNDDEVSYNGAAEWSYRRFVLHLAMLAKAAGNVDKFLLGSELRGLTRLRDEAGAYPAVEQLIALASEVRSILGPAVEISYAADWTEYGAYAPEDGSGDVLFPLDAFWSDANVDFIGLDWYAPLSDWRDGEHLDSALFPAIDDPAYLAANIEGGEGYDWYYASAADRDAQTRTPITDTAHGEDWVFRVKDIRSWWQNTHFERPVGARAVSPTQFIPASKPIRLIEIGCGAVDKGSNAPNVFIDPKSAESGLPHYSDGTRDDDIQRASILAIYDYWAENAPLSPIYGEAMIPADGLSVWCFDARPFPAFPARSDLWSDGANRKTGHWLNGRLSTSPPGAIIEEVCGNSVNVGAVNGHVPWYAVSGLSTVLEFLDPLAFAFSLTCRQSEAGLVFSNQPNGAAKQISFADYAMEKREFSAFTLKRELTEHGPKGVRVTVSDPSSDYQPVSVHVGDAPEGDRDLHIRLPMALDEAGATDLAAQIHGRVNADKTSQTLNISPARDDVTIGDLLHVEGEPLRVNGLERRGHIRVTLGYAEAAFAGAQSLPQTGSTAAHSPQPDLVVLDIPNMPGSEDDIRPLVGAFAHPWAGEINVSAGASSTSLSKRASLSQPAMIGRLLTPLPSGPGDRWRPGVSLDIRFPDAALAARDRVDVLNGANLIAVETNGGWMLACFQTAEMLSGDVWRISGLLTGLSGTEDLSTLGAEAGARLVIIDQALIRAELSAHELGPDLLWQAKGPGGLAEAETVALKLEGRAKKPLRPGHLRAETLAGGDIHLSWTRRARHSADRWDTPDVPLLEEALLFRVEVFAGEVLLRSEDVSDTVWVYSVDDQMNDAVNGAELRFRVVQVSPSYGDGVSAECVLT